MRSHLLEILCLVWEKFAEISAHQSTGSRMIDQHTHLFAGNSLDINLHYSVGHYTDFELGSWQGKGQGISQEVQVQCMYENSSTVFRNLIT